MGVNVEAGSFIARQPLALLKASCELARRSLCPLNVNYFLCFRLRPLGLLLLPVPAMVRSCVKHALCTILH